MSELTGFSNRPAWLSIILILITIFLGFVVIGPLIGFVLAMPFYDGTIFDLPLKLSNPTAHPEIRLPLLIMQGSATFFGLIVFPYLYLLGIEKVDAMSWLKNKHSSWLLILVTALTVISFMAPNSLIIEWNSNFVFPDFLKEFGEWARENETKAEEITRFCATFSSPGDFIMGMVIIALFPAIGEELAFRGMLQPELTRLTGNKHAGIWISAIIFSAFHMQFFGFVPRMLLGALFGYLYVWSGNFIFPMIAHFVNNGFLVLMLYLNQVGAITVDIDSPEAAPWPLIVSSTFVFAALLLYFKKYYDTHNLTRV
jgi:membrane protease YdiL (CAAX protease family)